MMREVLFICLTIFSFKSVMANNPELVIGEERVEPGIVYIFEGAIKDHVMPMSMHLSENETHVHIEARANWDSKMFLKALFLVDLFLICILMQKS